MAATEQVILVDEDDHFIGTAEKLQAHHAGWCHRAFSVFIFYNNLLLLQQRAKDKYHSPNLWTNTCCSHPRPGEEIIIAGQRRLKEEMGLEVPLQVAGRFHYIAHFNNGLIENEVDYVLVGITHQTEMVLNEKEAQAYRWISMSELYHELAHFPERFTPWLGQALVIAEKFISKRS